MFREDKQRTLHLGRWFLVSGGIGLAVAIILADLMSHDIGSLTIFEVLWPSGVAGVIALTGPGSQLVSACIMYGGQFVLYGLCGLLIMVIVHQFRSRRPSQHPARVQ